MTVILEKSSPSDSGSKYALSGNDAERRYRELALESCDIIDLANLPERDRHVATRQLELRRLYMALRVHVEIPSNIEAGEADLEAIEGRRRAMRHRASSSRGANSDESKASLPRVPIGKRLAVARRLVVLGDPGAGKTTMIRWIATTYLLRLKQDQDWKDLPDVTTLPDEDWFPIIVRCRDLDQPGLGGSLDDVLCHTLRKAEMTEVESVAFREVLQEKLRKGEALLLLDGLDEIVDPSIRIRFCQQLEQIHVACPEAPIIATSRSVGYREMGYRIGRGFEHITVAELSKEDKDDFARRWCAITELPERRAMATVELKHDIHSTDRIERLTANPMLLTTMALVKRKVGKLPSRRVDLYWDALEVLLNRRREVDDPIENREAVPQLEYVAYTMCDRGVQQLQEHEIIDLFDRMREEYPQVHPVRKHTAEEFLHLLERRTGILVEAGHVRHLGMIVPIVEFRHLTFREYLAARALVDGRFPGRDRSRTLADHVAPLAGRTSEVEAPQFGEREVAVTESWREALRLCEEFRRREGKTQVNVGAIWMGVAITSAPQDKAVIRERLTEQASWIASVDEVAAIGAALYATALSMQKGAYVNVRPGIVHDLLTMLMRSAAAAVAASMVLVAFNDPDFLKDNTWHPAAAEADRIISFIADPASDPIAVLLLLMVLSRERDSPAVEPLLTWLEGPDKELRGQAVEALGQIGDARAIEALKSRLSADNGEIRVIALEALSYTRKDRVDRKLLSRDFDALQPYLDLDPQRQIDEIWVHRAAEAMEISADEVRHHYEILAHEFSLKLSWHIN